jgi:hypothetical protein
VRRLHEAVDAALTDRTHTAAGSTTMGSKK